MSITDICILTNFPFGKRDYERFGVEILRQHFRVSILDCTAWLHPELWKKYGDTAFRGLGYESIADLKSLIGQINNPSKTVAIDYLGFCAGSGRVRMELKKRHVHRAIVHVGLLPAAPSSTKIRGLFFKTPAAVIRSIRWRCKHFLRNLLRADPAPEIALMSGAAGLKDAGVRGVAHKIWAHSFDYDIYLECKGQATVAVERYAVFLDQNAVSQLEAELLGLKPVTTVQNYYPSMNAYFNEFERDTGMRVIVAAHPGARYDLHPDLWRGRTIILGKTAQLVRDATLVLSHFTTAISFAVLWRKPVWVLTTDEFVRGVAWEMPLLSALLGAPLVNVDEHANQLPTIKALLAENEPAYAKYSEEYIKRSGTPNAPVWQIFSEYVQREFA